MSVSKQHATRLSEISIQDLDVNIQYHLQELPNYGSASVYVLTHYLSQYPGCAEMRKLLQEHRSYFNNKLKKRIAKLLSVPMARLAKLFFLNNYLPLYLKWMQWFFDYGAASKAWCHYKVWDALESRDWYKTEDYFLKRFEEQCEKTPEVLLRRAGRLLEESQYEAASSIAEDLSVNEVYAYEARKIMRKAAIGISMEENKLQKKPTTHD